jgi:hypothetical protein
MATAVGLSLRTNRSRAGEKRADGVTRRLREGTVEMNKARRLKVIRSSPQRTLAFDSSDPVLRQTRFDQSKILVPWSNRPDTSLQRPNLR